MKPNSSNNSIVHLFKQNNSVLNEKYLIYQDEGSHKFWSIEVSGSIFTVTFGKI
ncbi:hypothetical protein LEP1GSC133_2144 [Leptospira borgpetersenii serovar Pomona str. 200901868]|uniref:Uncharacterized protein n=1 Tax=Leptospira borgpetersenii serovar Pomona str. 200901868 TaxID=1192866 RepID=M6WNF0_LEPBO|nr:hypothetical protein LEP1GSC133_2144 [Leptospira borgpetersenii serovar Pomona str. 200901868]MBF3313483.1 hypothetical protein [Leptospira borgpetersenii serovar Hardjo-bovis]